MVIMHESMSEHLLAVYIMILIDAKGQVLEVPKWKPVKMYPYLPFTPVHLWICICKLDPYADDVVLINDFCKQTWYGL